MFPLRSSPDCANTTRSIVKKMKCTSWRKKQRSWSTKAMLAYWSGKNVYPICDFHTFKATLEATFYSSGHLTMAGWLCKGINSCWHRRWGKSILSQEEWGWKAAQLPFSQLNHTTSLLVRKNCHSLARSWTHMWTLQGCMTFLGESYRYVYSFQIGHQQTK